MQAIDEIASNLLKELPFDDTNTTNQHENLKSFEKLLLLAEEPDQATYYTPSNQNILSSNTNSLLEDYTPLSPTFYKLLYSLLCTGYSQELHFTQDFDSCFSLGRDIVHVRITRILHA